MWSWSSWRDGGSKIDTDSVGVGREVCPPTSASNMNAGRGEQTHEQEDCGKMSTTAGVVENMGNTYPENDSTGPFIYRSMAQRRKLKAESQMILEPDFDHNGDPDGDESPNPIHYYPQSYAQPIPINRNSFHQQGVLRNLIDPVSILAHPSSLKSLRTRSPESKPRVSADDGIFDPGSLLYAASSESVRKSASIEHFSSAIFASPESSPSPESTPPTSVMDSTNNSPTKFRPRHLYIIKDRDVSYQVGGTATEKLLEHKHQQQWIWGAPPLAQNLSVGSRQSSILVSRTEQELVKSYRGMKFGAPMSSLPPTGDGSTPDLNSVLNLLQMLRKTASADELKLLRDALSPNQISAVAQARQSAHDPLTSGPNARLIRRKSIVVTPGMATRIGSTRVQVEYMPPEQDTIPEVPEYSTELSVVDEDVYSQPLKGRNHGHNEGARVISGSNKEPGSRTCHADDGNEQLVVPSLEVHARVSSPGSVEFDYNLLAGFERGSLFVTNGAPSPDVSITLDVEESVGQLAKGSHLQTSHTIAHDSKKDRNTVGQHGSVKVKNPSNLTIKVPQLEHPNPQVIVHPIRDLSPLDTPFTFTEPFPDLRSPSVYDTSSLRSGSFSTSLGPVTPVHSRPRSEYVGAECQSRSYPNNNLLSPSPGLVIGPIRRRRTIGSLVRELHVDDDDMVSQLGVHGVDVDASFMSRVSTEQRHDLYAHESLDDVLGRHDSDDELDDTIIHEPIQPTQNAQTALDYDIKNFLPLEEEAIGRPSICAHPERQSTESRHTLDHLEHSPLIDEVIVSSFPCPPDNIYQSSQQKGVLLTAAVLPQDSPRCRSNVRPTSRSDSASLAGSDDTKTSAHKTDVDSLKSSSPEVKQPDQPRYLDVPLSSSRPGSGLGSRPNSQEIFGRYPAIKLNRSPPKNESASSVVPSSLPNGRTDSAIYADEVNLFKASMPCKDGNDTPEKTKVRASWRLFRRSMHGDELKSAGEVSKKDETRAPRSTSQRRLQKPRPRSMGAPGGRSRASSRSGSKATSRNNSHSPPPCLKVNMEISAIPTIPTELMDRHSGRSAHVDYQHIVMYSQPPPHLLIPGYSSVDDATRRSRRKSQATDECHDKKRRQSFGRRILNLRRRSKSASGRGADFYCDDGNGECGLEIATDELEGPLPKVKPRRSLVGLAFKKTAKPPLYVYAYNATEDQLPMHPIPYQTNPSGRVHDYVSTNMVVPPSDKESIQPTKPQLSTSTIPILSQRSQPQAIIYAAPSARPSPLRPSASRSTARPSMKTGTRPSANPPPKFAAPGYTISVNSGSNTPACTSTPVSPVRNHPHDSNNAFSSVRSFWQDVRPTESPLPVPSSLTSSKSQGNLKMNRHPSHHTRSLTEDGDVSSHGLGLAASKTVLVTPKKATLTGREVAGWPLLSRGPSLASPERRSYAGSPHLHPTLQDSKSARHYGYTDSPTLPSRQISSPGQSPVHQQATGTPITNRPSAVIPPRKSFQPLILRLKESGHSAPQCQPYHGRRSPASPIRRPFTPKFERKTEVLDILHPSLTNFDTPNGHSHILNTGRDMDSSSYHDLNGDIFQSGYGSSRTGNPTIAAAVNFSIPTRMGKAISTPADKVASPSWVSHDQSPGYGSENSAHLYNRDRHLAHLSSPNKDRKSTGPAIPHAGGEGPYPRVGPRHDKPTHQPANRQRDNRKSIVSPTKYPPTVLSTSLKPATGLSAQRYSQAGVSPQRITNTTFSIGPPPSLPAKPPSSRSQSQRYSLLPKPKSKLNPARAGDLARPLQSMAASSTYTLPPYQTTPGSRPQSQNISRQLKPTPSVRARVDRWQKEYGVDMRDVPGL